jgi:hypothetical protein
MPALAPPADEPVVTPPDVDPVRPSDPLVTIVPLVPAGVPVPAPELVPELAPLETPPPLELFATVSGCVFPLLHAVARRVRPNNAPQPRKTTTAVFM